MSRGTPNNARIEALDDQQPKQTLFGRAIDESFDKEPKIREYYEGKNPYNKPQDDIDLDKFLLEDNNMDS